MGRRMIDISRQRFGRLTAICPNGKTDKGEIKWLCVCDCGKHTTPTGSDLRGERISSCGCIRKDITRQRFGRLIALYPVSKKRRETYWLCECDCGKQKGIRVTSLVNGATQSCGCLRNERVSKANRLEIAGQRFGKLIAIKRHSKRHNRYLWLCQCDCGKETIVDIGCLMSENTQSCGNCGVFINGVPASRPQRKIAEMVGGTINYKVNGKYIDIAFPDEKVAIEYDCWYWHKDKLEKDEQRKRELLDDGWKILTIKSGKTVPTQDELIACLELLECTNDVELVLRDWGGR